MKAKLIINNQEIEVEISEDEYKKLLSKEKKTGYERVEVEDKFYYVSWRGVLELSTEEYDNFDTQCYEIANYYSNKTVAENNARADKLMRQLRRFAVEHREKEFDWNSPQGGSYYICYNWFHGKFHISSTNLRTTGAIYFDSEETAQLAIDTFHDELIWYFTEYKDSL